MAAAALVAQATGDTVQAVSGLDAGTIAALTEWGVAGAMALVALVMFWFYRKDFLKALNGAERREDRFAEVIERNSAAMAKLSEKLENFLDTRKG